MKEYKVLNVDLDGSYDEMCQQLEDILNRWAQKGYELAQFDSEEMRVILVRESSDMFRN